jgi:signal peptide peptidase SppA
MPSINPAYEFLGRVGNEPWLLAPTFTGLPAIIRGMLGAADLDGRAAVEDTAVRFGGQMDAAKPYAMAGSVAVIPVHGTLLNRFSGAWGFVTGYDYIRNAYSAALGDPSVRGIVFDVNSPGGDAQGCFELCDAIRAGRKVKPSMALVNANAMSGAYAIASAAGKIVATPSSRVGSVGVVTMHVDYSKALADEGVKVTFIFAGEHKVDGNPYEPLPKSVKNAIQSRVESSYAAFVGQVARNRGIDEDDVRGTEAAVFDARQALEIGFIDRIEDATTAFTAFAQSVSPHNREISQMTTKTDEGKATEQVVEPAAAVAEPAAPAAPVLDQAALIAAERERISAILGCEEATGRTALATHFALKTTLSLEDARAALAAAPTEGAKGSASAFLAAMDGSDHPEVGAGAAPAADPEPTSAAAIMRDYAAATGYKPSKTIQ